MQDLMAALRYRRAGLLFQFAMFALLLLRTKLYIWNEAEHPIAQTIDLVGTVLALYSMVTIYHRSKGRLLTQGVFRYTRHPMYTGIALMDLGFWFGNSYDAIFLGSACAFYLCLGVAGYLQELETLARFGEEAEWYYWQTPRFFFMYPFKLLGDWFAEQIDDALP